MKILQVMAGAAHGGAETAFIDMCVAMKDAGQDVVVATRKNPRNERLSQAGIPVYCFPFGGALDVYTPWRMRRLIEKFKPDIVQTWMARASWKTPAPSAGGHQYKLFARLGGYYSLKYFKNTQFFATITPLIKEYLVENGIPADHIRHINNFAETEFGAQPVSRESLDTPQDATVFLFLGRLHEAKAVDTMLNALASLNDPSLYLWIAGEGPDREALESLCDRLGLQGQVRFLGWRDDRAALFSSADICIFPSRYEPFGTVFVQAWAQDTPLITSDADGPRQYVRDGQDGLVFARDDVAGLASCMRRLVDDRDLRRKLAAAGRARYEEEFTKENTVNAYLAFYAQSLEAIE